jgi:cytochrome c oxidase subunit II
MLSLLIGLGVLLVLIVLYLLFRLGGTVAVAKGTFHKRETTANKVNAIMLPVVFIIGVIAAFWYNGRAVEHFLPESASEHGLWTDELFWVTTGIIGFVFIVTNFILFYFAFRYRYREDRKATFYPDNNKLELIWTVIPAIVLTVLVLAGLRTWNKITMSDIPDDALKVEIKGKQFAWEVRYPGDDGKFGDYDFRLIDAINQFGIDFTDESSLDDFMPRKIYLQKGRPVFFKIRAVDVLHSVFAPHFRLKMDAVPGMETQFLFTPIITTEEMREKTGNPDFQYEMACTEICGRGHFAMKMIIVVVEEDEYKSWYAEQTPWAESNMDYVKDAIQKRGTNQALLNKIDKMKSSL